jgi:hypothetical protein
MIENVSHFILDMIFGLFAILINNGKLKEIEIEID